MKKKVPAYQFGGSVKGDDEKTKKEKEIAAKALAAKTTVNVPNPNFPSPDEQMYAKGHMNLSELKMRQSEARMLKGSGTSLTGRPTYGIQDPRLEMNRPKKAKGGKVMKTAPCMKKGGKC